VLRVREPDNIITPAIFTQRLDLFLRQNRLDLSSPILVVGDKTRLCGYPQYLPLLIELLKKQGMAEKDLKIIIAYGTHPRQSDEECFRAYGDMYRHLTFLHHDCHVKSDFIDLGKTSRNTPILFRRDLVRASAVITMGAICHHYFAGFGGGRKLIFPGCGEKEAIYANHRLYLDIHKGILATRCQAGILDGNPLAEDLFEVEKKLQADLAIHGILDSHGQLRDLLVGNGRDDFLAACRIHAGNCEVKASQSDIVIGSCGGFPKDINFIQSHKGIHNAAMFVRDGGLLLIYAECQDGIGSTTFLPWLQKGSFAAAFAELANHYEGNGGTALALMTKLQRIRIGIITGIDDTVCRTMGLEHWSHNEVNDYLGKVDGQKTVCQIPNASLLVKAAE
jgi:nickel-dependent lactate racemase